MEFQSLKRSKKIVSIHVLAIKTSLSYKMLWFQNKLGKKERLANKQKTASLIQIIHWEPPKCMHDAQQYLIFN